MSSGRFLTYLPVKTPENLTTAVVRIRNQSGKLTMRWREGSTTPVNAGLPSRDAVTPDLTVLKQEVSFCDHFPFR